jgi:hypothetical protein
VLLNAGVMMKGSRTTFGLSMMANRLVDLCANADTHFVDTIMSKLGHRDVDVILTS